MCPNAADDRDLHFEESLQRWAKSSDDALDRYMKNLKSANDAARREFTDASVRYDRMTRTNRSVIGSNTHHSPPEKKAKKSFVAQGAVRYVAIPFMCTPEMFAQYQSMLAQYQAVNKF